MSKNDPAFPIFASTGDPRDGVYCRDGLTKREQAAIQIMAGMCANPGGPIQANGMSGWGLCNCTHEQAATAAIYLADVLLDQLEKHPSIDTNEPKPTVSE